MNFVIYVQYLRYELLRTVVLSDTLICYFSQIRLSTPHETVKSLI